jgi:hypothetical protein
MSDSVIYQENVNAFLVALNLLKAMEDKGIIDAADFKVSLRVLANRYGIKANSVFRIYGLDILPQKSDVCNKKEVFK